MDFIEILKFGHDDNYPECELKYDVHVKHMLRDKDGAIELGTALVFAESTDDFDIYTLSFFWDKDDKESMDFLYNRLSKVYGVNTTPDLYDNTIERLKRGISEGLMEVVSVD